MNSIYTLEQWLSKATKNLAPDAISSIKKEITDHFQTSLERYERRGISRVEAESLVLRDLGDPDKSGKKFRKSYLTVLDQFVIETLGNIKFVILIGSIFQIILSIYKLNISFDMYQNGHYNNLASVEQNLKYFSWQVRAILTALQDLCSLIANIGFVLFGISIYNIKKTMKVNSLAEISWYIFITWILLFFIRFILFMNFKSIVDRYNLLVDLFPFVSQTLVFNGILWLLLVKPVLRKLRPGTRASS